MKKKTVYLAGPIFGCETSECRDWRGRVNGELAGVYDFRDPMARDYRGREGEAVAEIVSGDLADIDASDIVVALASRPSFGTAMEIFYAHRAGKVVVTISEPDHVGPGIKLPPVSPWLRHHSTHLCRSVGEAIELLAGLAERKA